MKAWAEKRRLKLEATGEAELANMFELVVKMCELYEVDPYAKATTSSADSFDISKPTCDGTRNPAK